MKAKKSLLVSTMLATGLGVGTAAVAQEWGVPIETTREHLLNADDAPHNWLMYHGNLSGWHYSALDQINKENVGQLRVVFQASIGGCGMKRTAGGCAGEQGQPVAENGVVYLTDGQNKVMAFNVASGDRAYPLWRFDPQVERTDRARGVALFGNNVIQTTADARIIAIDKNSGEMVWEAGAQEPVDQPNSAEAIATRAFTGTPAVIPTAGGQNIITVGPRGAGVGYMAAYDADNEGQLLWRTYTIPQPGEENFGTWPEDKWRWGAAMPWGAAPTYDPETNTMFFGTGEPSPVYDPEFRPGDNLYSVSTLALDADTGEMKWWFQEVPNDQWDYDSTSTRILHTMAGPDGNDLLAVTNWARNGFTYTLERNTGEFVRADAQLDNINWTQGIDEKTGLPLEYDPNAGLQEYAVAGPRRGRSEADAPEVCATWGGGATGIWPASYDPTTGITYNTRTTGCTYQTIITTTDENFNPLQREGLGSVVRQVQVNTEAALIAIDTATGEVVNTYIRNLEIPGDRQAEVGALATAGGLVFTAFDDGSVQAFDKDTLEELWRFNNGTSMKGGMMSFAVDGNQYIAHIIGGDDPSNSGIGRLVMPTAMLVVYGL
jgi:alcohol dehydrogenase (cytochrome c)